MRIGVVTTSYPRTQGDAAGSFVAAHARALVALGHDVEVIAAGSAVARGGPRADREAAADRDEAIEVPDDRAPATIGSAPRVIRIASPPGLFYTGGAPDHLEQHPLRALATSVTFTTAMTATVARHARRWDRIVAHWLAPSALAALPTRPPLIAIAHGGDVHTLRRMRLLSVALHALRARGAQLVFVSEALRDLARAEVPRLAAWLDDAMIQPMGLDLARFHAIERAPREPATILVVARLIPLKGVDVAIDAIEQVQARTQLWIVGDGPARATLERRARDRPAVRFFGAVGPDVRDDLLRSASLVVVPSRVLPSGRTEGMPMIALEALAAGVPLVASAVGGLATLGPAATLVAPGRAAELARAIDLTLTDPPCSSELRAAVAHLDWTAVATRLGGM